MNDPQQQEKRRFSRVPFDTRTTLLGPSRRWESHLLDISLKGALITQPDNWPGQMGDHFTLQIELGDHADIIITMAVRVAHIEKGHVGCECVDIDVDSIGHLRRLMELNLGNTDLLERELSVLWHTATRPTD